MTRIKTFALALLLLCSPVHFSYAQGVNEKQVDAQAEALKPTTVSFSDSQVKVGFMYINDRFADGVDENSLIGTIQVSATVEPPADVNKVTIKVESATDAHVAIVPLSTDEATGTIVFRVRGLAESETRAGDTIIAAKGEGPALAQMSAVVVIPKKVIADELDPPAIVTARNIVASSTTSPAYPGYFVDGVLFPVPPGKQVLRTVYQFDSTISIFDQFGDPIGATYTGASVYELFQGFDDYVPINQKVSALGTYKDPVAMAYTKLEGLDPKLVEEGSAEAADWVAQRGPGNQPIPATNEQDDAPVSVAIADNLMPLDRRVTLIAGPPVKLRVKNIR